MLGCISMTVSDTCAAQTLKTLGFEHPLWQLKLMDRTCYAFSMCLLQTEEPVSIFIQCEEEARKGHIGIWIHGDPGSESDEEDATPSKPAWGRR